MALTEANAGGLVSRAGGNQKKGGSVRVEILRHTVAAGEPVFEGDEITLDDAEAKVLIGYGKAKKIAAGPSKSSGDDSKAKKKDSPKTAAKRSTAKKAGSK